MAAALDSKNGDVFPAGLRVLVVDDDATCLRILEQSLRRCSFQVTCCTKAEDALSRLREKKGYFDVVLSDVHMPDMDGYKLLEHVGLEMDLPVIMMSADGRTSAVMKGIRHGACDYLIKPIREEELKNIWQHVVRKKWNGNKEHDPSGSLEDNDPENHECDDSEYASSVNERNEQDVRLQKRRNNAEDDGELDNDDPSTSKKPRVVWAIELHQQFVIAVNQLGIDRAVPKRILELMNVPGLTRENVASHLQKYRLYLKRLIGTSPQQGGSPNMFYPSVDPIVKFGSLRRYDQHAPTASGHFPPETLAALHTQLLGQSAANLSPAMGQHALLYSSLQENKSLSVENGITFGQQSLVNCAPSNVKPFMNSAFENASPTFGVWQTDGFGRVVDGNNPNCLGNYDNTIFMDMLQRNQNQKNSQIQLAFVQPHHSVNVQPSCLVAPSQSLSSFQVGDSLASFNQNNFGRSDRTDYRNISPPSNDISFTVGKVSGPNAKPANHWYSSMGSSSSSASLSYLNADIQNSPATASASTQVPGIAPNASFMQSSCVAKPDELCGRVPVQMFGLAGNETSIPTRFIMDEFNLPRGSMNNDQPCTATNGTRLKENTTEFVDIVKVGNPVLPPQSSNNASVVFSQ